MDNAGTSQTEIHQPKKILLNPPQTSLIELYCKHMKENSNNEEWLKFSADQIKIKVIALNSLTKILENMTQEEAALQKKEKKKIQDLLLWKKDKRSAWLTSVIFVLSCFSSLPALDDYYKNWR